MALLNAEHAVRFNCQPVKGGAVVWGLETELVDRAAVLILDEIMVEKFQLGIGMGFDPLGEPDVNIDKGLAVKIVAQPISGIADI